MNRHNNHGKEPLIQNPECDPDRPERDDFMTRARNIILAIPPGKVMSYGLVATWAGNPRGARQVARLLHSSSRTHNLPWHRIVNRHGSISLKPFQGYEIQKQLLEMEGVVFSENGTIDTDIFLWHP
ncbi:MAG: MGMT family protein [Pseudomonadota bacterium]